MTTKLWSGLEIGSKAFFFLQFDVSHMPLIECTNIFPKKVGQFLSKLLNCSSKLFPPAVSGAVFTVEIDSPVTPSILSAWSWSSCAHEGRLSARQNQHTAREVFLIRTRRWCWCRFFTIKAFIDTFILSLSFWSVWTFCCVVFDCLTSVLITAPWWGQLNNGPASSQVSVSTKWGAGRHGNAVHGLPDPSHVPPRRECRAQVGVLGIFCATGAAIVGLILTGVITVTEWVSVWLNSRYITSCTQLWIYLSSNIIDIVLWFVLYYELLLCHVYWWWCMK